MGHPVCKWSAVDFFFSARGRRRRREADAPRASLYLKALTANLLISEASVPAPPFASCGQAPAPRPAQGAAKLAGAALAAGIVLSAGTAHADRMPSSTIGKSKADDQFKVAPSKAAKEAANETALNAAAKAPAVKYVRHRTPSDASRAARLSSRRYL